jgi:hypothetical protein
MATIDWPIQPILTMTKNEGSYWEQFGYDWRLDEGHNFPIPFAGPGLDTLRISIHLVNNSGNTGQEFSIRVEKLFLDNTVDGSWNYYSEHEYVYAAWDTKTINIEIPITSLITKFRITGKIVHTYRQPSGSPEYFPEGSYDFVAYTEHFGDFTLDYVPISIVYCPHCKEGTNALTTTDAFGTVVTVGESRDIQTERSSGHTVRGGVRISSLDDNSGVSGSVGYTETELDGSSGEDSVTSALKFTYQWSSSIIADNQRAIGRAYFGPLSDLFVILKNPWFELTGDENNNVYLGVSELTSVYTEILILPAHKLLRPGRDPIANRIPPETRRQILSLDPFICNLDPFFPPDGSDPDPSVDLSLAINPYRDPSSENRAALIAKYSLDTGVVLELSHHEQIDISTTITNSKSIYSRVGEKITRDVDVFTTIVGEFFKLGLSLGYTGEDAESEFVRIAYHKSFETFDRHSKTAQCKLIRNQNHSDLCDIEVWLDKLFSTFMFRKIEPQGSPGSGIIGGAVILQEEDRLRHVEVALAGEEETYTTTTNHLGNFVFQNLAAGSYKLKVGDKTKNIRITKKDIEKGAIRHVEIRNARRALNLRKAPLWELAEAFEVSLPVAKKIQVELSKVKRIKAKTLEKIARKYRLSLPHIRKRNLIKYS